MLTEVQMPVSGPPLFRLVQLAGSPDPEAPKTRLPLARICWEATFDIQRFDAQRAQVTEEMRRYQHTITDL